MTARDAAGSRRGLVVELVGIPGAGKSRRVRMLAETLTRRGIAVAEPQARFGPSVPTGPRLARKTLASGATALSAPATTVRVLNGLVRSRQPGPADVAGRAVQWLVAQDVLARAARRDGVSLVDEGLIQALWSTGLRGDVDGVLAALARPTRWHSPDLLAVVRLPPEAALDRLVARASRHSRTQRLEPSEQLAELRRGADLLDRLVDWWSREAPGSSRVFTVTGTDDDAGDRALLVERVLETLSR